MREPLYLGCMQPSDHGPVETQVRAAIDTEPAAPHDAGTVALAITYAALIDAAAPTAALAKALEIVDPHIPAAPATADAWRKITAALAAHTVASDLGPKLLATLEALLLSPRARAAAKKAVTPDDKPATPLDELRQLRARKSRTAAVDSAAAEPV